MCRPRMWGHWLGSRPTRPDTPFYVDDVPFSADNGTKRPVRLPSKKKDEMVSALWGVRQSVLSLTVILTDG